MGADVELDRDELRATVERTMTANHAPGVAVGITYQGHELTAGFGVTSVENPLPVTENTLFQIGSVTKTVTGTLSMRLAETGKLDLDAPLRTYLPGLRLSDEETAARITMRHLFTHTSGILGDYFDDPGRGEDALERMTEIVGTLPQLTPLGAFWSYCNSGFYLAGRVIEVLTDMPYEQAAKEMVLDPLEMTQSFFFPEDVMTCRFVVGHEVVDDETSVARPWALPRVIGPVGGIVASAPEILKYARFHMGDGTTEAGRRILRPESMRQMQAPFAPSTGGQYIGLTWHLRDVDGTRIVGHSGSTNGQSCLLTLVPQCQFGIITLTNVDQVLILQDVRDWALKRYLDIAVPMPQPVDITEGVLTEYAGRYEAGATMLDLIPEDGKFHVQITPKGGFPFPDSAPGPTPPPFHAILTEDDGIAGVGDGARGPLGEFIRSPEGAITWLRFGARMHQRL